MKSKSKFFDLETPDFTANSRNILNDLLNSAIKNGLDISVNNEYLSHNDNEDFYKFLDDRFEKLLMLDNMRRF